MTSLRRRSSALSADVSLDRARSARAASISIFFSGSGSMGPLFELSEVLPRRLLVRPRKVVSILRRPITTAPSAITREPPRPSSPRRLRLRSRKRLRPAPSRANVEANGDCHRNRRPSHPRQPGFDIILGQSDLELDELPSFVEGFLHEVGRRGVFVRVDHDESHLSRLRLSRARTARPAEQRCSAGGCGCWWPPGA